MAKAKFDPVETQLAAYNARDIDAFVACYNPNCPIDVGEDTRLMTGHAEMRARYQALFDGSPNLRGEIIHRKRVGDYVVTEESLTGVLPGTHIVLRRELVIYRIDKVTGLIAHVRLLR